VGTASRRAVRFVGPVLATAFIAGCGPTGLNALRDLGGCDPTLAAGVDGSEVDLHRTATPALACTLSALRDVKGPGPAQALQAARVCSELSSRETDDDRMERFANECIRWAKTAATDPTLLGAARYWQGACLGNAVRNSPLKAVQNLSELERMLTEAVQADPTLDDGGPLRVLGMLYIKAPAWPQGVGDVDRGMELIGEAAERFPDHPLNRMFLALALWDVDEDRDAAARELGIALDRLKSERWKYIAPFWRKEAVTLAGEVGVPMAE